MKALYSHQISTLLSTGTLVKLAMMLVTMSKYSFICYDDVQVYLLTCPT
jgi:hypothetical protein